jgi:hypothetical protein
VRRALPALALRDNAFGFDGRMEEDRMYQADDSRWYFKVRGKLVKGPFESRQDAQVALDEHVKRCCRSLRGPLWVQSLKPLRANATRTT